MKKYDIIFLSTLTERSNNNDLSSELGMVEANIISYYE